MPMKTSADSFNKLLDLMSFHYLKIDECSVYQSRAVITRMYVCKVLQVLQDQGSSPSIW